ncbi:MAG TPA: hypothetical protein PKI19_06630 [Elusimicrobiales bacterium]|nr:hypothetical protein [Elusimicrobiales bacterium]
MGQYSFLALLFLCILAVGAYIGGRTGTIVGIFVLIYVVLFAGLGLYYFIKRLKGEIKIYLPTASYDPGNTIEGLFKLSARREINGENLTAALVAVVPRPRDMLEVFRIACDIEPARNYPAAYSGTYNFKLTLPMPGDPALAQALKKSNFANPRLRWKVNVHLAAKGMDLDAEEFLSVKNINW